MSCYVVVQVPNPALTKRARTLLVREVESRKAARAFIRTNRETWRAALVDDESRVVALVLDARMEAVEAIELDRTWGSPGETHGRDTVRSMLSAIRHDLPLEEMKTS